MAGTSCSDFGAAMLFVENGFYNSYYMVKRDTFVCTHCKRTVETARKIPGHEYK